MKKVILVTSGSQAIGIFTNLLAFWELIDNRESKQHYATVSKGIQYGGRSYDLGDCVIDGKTIENVTIRKVEVNTLLAR